LLLFLLSSCSLPITNPGCIRIRALVNDINLDSQLFGWKNEDKDSELVHTERIELESDPEKRKNEEGCQDEEKRAPCSFNMFHTEPTRLRATRTILMSTPTVRIVEGKTTKARGMNITASREMSNLEAQYEP